jgi:hypothetical protein
MTKIDEQIKARQDEKAAEKWTGIRPSAKQCKQCIHALEDTKFTIGAEKANCEMFVSPYDKTPGILTDEITCPYFEKK